VQPATAVEFLEELRRCDGLELAFVLHVQLPARVVEGEQERPEGLRCLHLGRDDSALEPSGSRRQVELELPHLAERPAAGERLALPGLDVLPVAGLADLPVDDVEVGAEHVAYLVVLVGHHRLEQGDDVGPQLAETFDEHRAPSLPVAAPAPEILRHDPHCADATASEQACATRPASPSHGCSRT
jgi:hypothetical protein